MSGGSMNYLYCQVRDAVGMMADAELDDLINDVADLLHDCEWWHSCDYGEETYRKSVAKFKAKWFGKSKTRTERLERLIDERIEKARRECKQMIGLEVQENA